jgi:hypothetical protein
MTGDSITYGYTFDPTPIADRLATLLRKPVVALGVGSDVAANISSRHTRYCLPYSYKFAIWEGCTNDFGINSASGATCWATTAAWIVSVKAAGQTPVILAVFCRGGSGGWTGPKETARTDWNTLAAAAAAADPTIIYVDPNPTLCDSASPPALKVAYDWGDHLHIDGDGMQVVAEALYSAMQ